MSYIHDGDEIEVVDTVVKHVEDFVVAEKLFTTLDVARKTRQDPKFAELKYKDIKKILNEEFQEPTIDMFENYARVLCKFDVDGQEKKAFIYYPCDIDSDENILTPEEAKAEYDAQSTLVPAPVVFNLEATVESLVSEWMSDDKLFTAFDITKEIRKTQQVHHFEVKALVEKFYSELVDTTYTRQEFHFVKDSNDYFANMYLPASYLASFSNEDILEKYYDQFEVLVLNPVPVAVPKTDPCTLCSNCTAPAPIPVTKDETDVSLTLHAKHVSGDTQTDAKIKLVKDLWNMLFA